ncbi:hypothetical protein [Flavisolibacter ginsengisoli]|jgi:hypothetical protein|uniref:Uncharacterized protein n=1 Tax=Flavisolibacter ginsengisoli DSM 18119 TaxID=1121884 RepID=A0A1M5FV79_9BACT|nr:hypothetical protein [Flavisolibacter ginsengisoli]SHF95393.1 hypothetical protein SAMN02745131_03947 [Flavisolibacter ginsengisoli DSM 18119]
MEKFFVPTNIDKFVKWALDQADLRHSICVVEYSEPAMMATLMEHAALVDLPKTAGRNYSDSSLLVAFEPRNASLEFTRQIVTNSHALSVYNDDKMQLLIADDYHPDCFSCSAEFYNQHVEELRRMKLVSA